MHEISEQMSRRINILRGFLCLSVFFLHINPIIQNYLGPDHLVVALFRHGYLAVPMFFILSGFLITHSYLKISQTKMRHGLIKTFYIKRFFRTIPVWFFCILAYLLFKNQISFFAFFNSFFFLDVIRPNTYAQQLIPPAWSLYLEELFYLIFPLLWMFAIRFWPLIWIALFIILGYFLEAQIELRPGQVFYNPFFNFNYFFVGILLYTYQSFIRKHLSFLPVFGILIALLAWISNHAGFTYLFILAGICIYFLLAQTKTMIVKFLLPIEKLGKVCYPFYLLHMIGISTAARLSHTLLAEWPSNSFGRMLTVVLTSLVITLFLSIVIHLSLELPFIRFGRKLTRAP